MIPTPISDPMLAFFFINPAFDMLFILATLIGVALTGWAQLRVKSAFKKYDSVGVRSGMTGAEAAEAVCRAGGVTGVTIEPTQGFLSDHYDPRNKTLRLSEAVYNGRSISAIAVAAHEAGHAIQHAEDYGPLGFRSVMVPVTNIGGGLWSFVFMIGVVLQVMGSVLGPTLLIGGVALFALVVLFQVITLPVEIDASKRAKLVLAGTGIVSTPEEEHGVDKVLDAAAMTYIAAAAASLLQLLALIVRVSGMLNQRD